jgi:hypothetical protein
VCEGGRPSGDVNFDCVFDGADVVALREFSLDSIMEYGFEGFPDQAAVADVTRNGRVSVGDALFAHQVDQSFLRFVGDVTVSQPAADSKAGSCNFVLSAKVTYGDGTPARAEDTGVYFALEGQASVLFAHIADKNNIVRNGTDALPVEIALSTGA